MCDPILLEIAEIINEFRSLRTTVMICSKRLKRRSGQRFVAALQSLGHRVLSVPDSRLFNKWAMNPRAFESAEELVLVIDWQDFSSCIEIVDEAKRRGTVDLNLCCLVALCERREQFEAPEHVKTLASSAGLSHCPC